MLFSAPVCMHGGLICIAFCPSVIVYVRNLAKIQTRQKSLDRPITVAYTVLGPMVRHYALGYGFHTFPNLKKTSIKRGARLCYVFGDLWKP